MAKLISLFQNDLKIIAAMHNGDDSVLGDLYEKNIKMILKYIKENHGSDYEASEYLQDASVILWENVHKGRFVLSSKISTFLYAVVKKRWMQELARRKRHIALDGIDNNPSYDKSAEDDILDSETIEIVKQCMTQLSTLCQKILMAYYYEEKSMQEIYKLAGLANENVAKSKKYQCKKQLEQLVKSALTC